MHLIESYIEHLEKLAVKPLFKRKRKTYIKNIELALNGQLSKTLREFVSMPDLLESGAFFTGEPMANQLVASIPAEELASITALDSACGGGNLLLALARRLALAATLTETIDRWGEQLYGMDIHLQFVRATRARLILLATLRGLAEVGPSFFECPKLILAETFPHVVVVENSLEVTWPKVERYLLNPPFNRVPVPAWCRWATGRVSQASLFISKAFEQAEPESIIHAILPDVLRSGSNYNRWRRHVENSSTIELIEPLGQFDDDTHVDVFSLTLIVREQLLIQPTNWVNNAPVVNIAHTVGQLFQVNVGRVVPHRDAEIGTVYPYLDVHNVPAWGTIMAGQDERRFSGTTFTTPFVVVRRTSRANYPYRAVGTVIEANESANTEQVAVENHLIVLRPHSGALADCTALLERLHDQRTNDWLNECIRCRHLTVGSVQSIPWWPNV
ncbi:hypothetical protein ACVWYF_004360 [Hymenobacter sp. UYAg731]